MMRSGLFPRLPNRHFDFKTSNMRDALTIGFPLATPFKLCLSVDLVLTLTHLVPSASRSLRFVSNECVYYVKHLLFLVE